MPPICRNQGHSHLSLSAQLGVNEAHAFWADLRATPLLPNVTLNIPGQNWCQIWAKKKSTCDMENRLDDPIKLLLF